MMTMMKILTKFNPPMDPLYMSNSAQPTPPRRKPTIANVYMQLPDADIVRLIACEGANVTRVSLSAASDTNVR